jgi:DNA (cytosine-5)-methyltransferase 1
MTPELVLSVFPGLDMLGRAFDAEGYCVVRGPDVIMGQDIRGWHTPSGVFEGVIGGPPCQCFSKTRNMIAGEPRFGDLIPEFCRVVSEAQPRWWLMENITEAPIPLVTGYETESFILSPRDLGDQQSRRRRFTLGYYAGLRYPLPELWKRLPLVALEHIDREPTVTSGKGGGRRDGTPYRDLKRIAEIQGYPELAELRHSGDWTVAGLRRAIAQGVPRVMGEALARAIREWQEGRPPDSSRQDSRGKIDRESVEIIHPARLGARSGNRHQTAVLSCLHGTVHGEDRTGCSEKHDNRTK